MPSLPGDSSKGSRIADVDDSPPNLTYVVEPQGAWHYAMARQFLSNAALGANIPQENLLEAVENRHSGVVISPSSADSQDIGVINQVVNGKADVAFMTQPDVSLLESRGLEKQTVGYDALVVFVPFSDPYHFNKIPEIQEINRPITLEELKQLYTGETDIPQFPGRQFQVRLFFSEDEDTVQRFRSQVLGNDPDPVLVEKFNQLQRKARERDEKAAARDRAPKDVYNRLWADANRTDNGGVIGIGFDRLGRMFDQCSVYPLAISEREQPPQVLVRSDGNPIGSNIDLCGEKGSYLPSIQDYPLKYELDLVFHKGSKAGTALTKMLRTTEGQYLMSEVGLIPEQPVPDLLRKIWG